MPGPQDPFDRRELWTWVPAGVAAGTLLALVRALAQLTAMRRRVGAATAEQDHLLCWSVSDDFAGILLEGVVVALIGSVLAHHVVRDPRRPRWLWLAVAVAFFTFLFGWPLAPEAQRAAFHVQLAWDAAGLQLVLSAAAALGLFRLVRGAIRRRDASERAGGALVLGVFVTVLLAGLALGLSRVRAGDPPTYEVREIARDLLTTPGTLDVIEERPDAPVRPAVFTPAVAQHSDAADKPSLWMAPPCRVRFTVLPEDGPCVLRASAGVDKSVRDALPEGVPGTVDFAIDVNGEPAFATSIVSERPPAGTWDPSEWIWHHAGGEAGIALEPGDVVTLRTSLPADDPLARLPGDKLRVGFGELVLERSRVRERTRPTADAPNIVLIVMDTQRVDRLSCYGYERPTTPNLDRLAAQGVLYEDVCATASWTWPSTASILTGLSADAHGVTSNASCTLSLSLESLAEALQLEGYTTAAFSCNPLIAAERYFDQGFELFDYSVPFFRMSDEVMPDVLRWLDANAQTRFFLYLHLADPHTPHRPHPDELARLGFTRPDDFPENGMDVYAQQLLNGGTPDAIPETHRRWILDQYDASVATGDRWLGELFAALDAHGLEGRTVVAFTSDHGEELFDHNRLAHGHTIYRELIEVPLILRGPGIPAGRTVGGVTSNRHLAPTLARIAGTALPGVDDGEDLLLDDPRGLAMFQTLKGVWNGQKGCALYGLRRDDWTLLFNRSVDDDRAPDADDLCLFEVGSDPNEHTDRSEAETRRVGEMLAGIRRRLKAQQERAPSALFGAGGNALDALEAGGYMGGDQEEDQEDH